MILINNFQGRLAVNTNHQPTKDACYSVFQDKVKNWRYKLKKKYFSGIPVDQIRTTSPVSYMTDAQWNDLVQKWLDPKNMVCCICCSLYELHS